MAIRQLTGGLIAFAMAFGTAGYALAADAPDEKAPAARPAKGGQWDEQRHDSKGSVTVGGATIEYTAVSGSIMIEDKKDQPGAMMTYTAYFKKAEGGTTHRPITFLYNGGPGSASFWLHMGSLGPKRVVVGDAEHTASAPYKVLQNEYSGLDASDLVFVDAPGTGFSRVGVNLKNVEPEKADAAAKRNAEQRADFYGVDQDGRAFTIFITKFLNKFDRWNSPRFLFGESYGTMRSAVLAHMLQRANIDLNGVMLLSQVLNYGSGSDAGRHEIGEDIPFQMSLPSYAATAWYHHKVANQPDLEAFLAEVKRFDIQEFGPALMLGDSLPAEQKRALAQKLSGMIGLPADYIERADLRILGGMFRKKLLEDQGLIVGRLDGRYTGVPQDPMAKENDYDPQSAAISSAYTAAYNDYARTTLGFGKDDDFHPTADSIRGWDTKHQPPGTQLQLAKTTNVIPDLSATIKQNPKMKVMLMSGYYDLATLWYAGEYELGHMGLPPDLMKNVRIEHFKTGHMVYVNEDALKQLHGLFSQFVTANSK